MSTFVSCLLLLGAFLLNNTLLGRAKEAFVGLFLEIGFQTKSPTRTPTRNRTHPTRNRNQPHLATHQSRFAALGGKRQVVVSVGVGGVDGQMGTWVVGAVEGGGRGRRRALAV